jgi:hypothetical protein
MSQLLKTKCQDNFKDFKRFGAFKELVEQKNLIFNSLVCKLGIFLHNYYILILKKSVPMLLYKKISHKNF